MLRSWVHGLARNAEIKNKNIEYLEHKNRCLCPHCPHVKVMDLFWTWPIVKQLFCILKHALIDTDSWFPRSMPGGNLKPQWMPLRRTTWPHGDGVHKGSFSTKTYSRTYFISISIKWKWKMSYNHLSISVLVSNWLFIRTDIIFLIYVAKYKACQMMFNVKSAQGIPQSIELSFYHNLKCISTENVLLTVQFLASPNIFQYLDVVF